VNLKDSFSPASTLIVGGSHFFKGFLLIHAVFLFRLEGGDNLNTTIFEIQKSSYPKEVVLHAIKYSPHVVSFEVDETTKPEIFSFSIVSKILIGKDLHDHLMERIHFSYLRFEVSKKTQSERELIIGRSLYRSCVQVNDE